MKPLASDLDACRLQGHKLLMIGSDKTPLKRSLLCITCSLANQRNTFAAFGEEHRSFGVWPDKRKE